MYTQVFEYEFDFDTQKTMGIEYGYGYGYLPIPILNTQFFWVQLYAHRDGKEFPLRTLRCLMFLMVLKISLLLKQILIITIINQILFKIVSLRH
jgi:hypothetical protein